MPVVLINSNLQPTQLVHLAARMQNGRMITAAERVAYFWKAVISQLFGERHGQLAGPGNGTATTLRHQGGGAGRGGGRGGRGGGGGGGRGGRRRGGGGGGRGGGGQGGAAAGGAGGRRRPTRGPRRRTEGG